MIKNLILLSCLCIASIMIISCGKEGSGLGTKPLKPFDLTSGWCHKAENINTPRCIDILEKDRKNYYQ